MRNKFPNENELGDAELVRDLASQVKVQDGHLTISLKGRDTSDDQAEVHTNNLIEETLHIAWQKPPSKRKREIILPVSAARSHKPIRAETRASLVSAIAKGRRWLNDLVAGRVKTLDEIASSEGCSTRKVEMTLSLAFLAPGLVKAAIEGRLPHGLGMVRLYDLPAEWSQQYIKLGLPRPERHGNYISQA